MTSLMTFLIVSFFSSCSIYQSPQRQTFENEYQQYQTNSLQNLRLRSCSSESVQSKAIDSELILNDQENQLQLWTHTIVTNTEFNESIIITQHESNNFKGDYCLYE